MNATISKLPFLQSLLEHPELNVKASWQSKIISDLDHVADMIDKRCSNMKNLIADGVHFYRGDYNLSTLSTLINTEGAKRHSKESNNVYQVMLDHVLEKRGLPKRSTSIIFTTHFDEAEKYGYMYHVFPFNGSIIAHADEVDIFESKIKVPLIDGVTLVELDKVLYRDVISIYSGASVKIESLEQLDTIFAGADPTVLALMITWAFHERLSIAMTDRMFDLPKPRDEQAYIKRQLASFTSYDQSDAFGAAQKAVALIKDKKISLKKDIAGLAKIFESNKSKKGTALAKYLFNSDSFNIGTFKMNSGISKSTVMGELSSHSECWLSGEAILVPDKLIPELFKRLGALGWPTK